ncbi:hypothetical protein F4804DRAFT_219812 [Jackrogersella minutella]|nr:hypothetical protein F4804DRAFT_219812 [Jackrogersella minutella]
MPPSLPMRCTRAYSPSSFAKFFVRLTNASSPSPLCSNTSILDVLLPPPRARSFHLAAAARQAVPLRSRSRNTRPRSDGNSSMPAAAARRPFSMTASRRKTQVAYNPQKDEDGNDMLLEITPRAAHRLSKIMTKDQNPNLALRISVESGGCHGFQYLMSLTTLPPSMARTAAPGASRLPPETSSSPPEAAVANAEETAASAVAPSTTTSASPSPPSIGEDDTIFEFVKDAPADDHDAEATPAPKVILDSPSLSLLKGSKVDFTMELIGSQFKIVDNPAASSSCGCGTSFDVKF